MKKEINPTIAIGIIVAVVIVGGLVLWKTTGGRSPSQGRLQSDVDMSKVDTNSEAFQKGVEDLLARDRASQQKK